MLAFLGLFFSCPHTSRSMQCYESEEKKVAIHAHDCKIGGGEIYNSIHGSYLLFWPVKRFEFIFWVSKWFEWKSGKKIVHTSWIFDLFVYWVCSVFSAILAVDIQYHHYDWTTSNRFDPSFCCHAMRFHCLL